MNPDMIEKGWLQNRTTKNKYAKSDEKALLNSEKTLLMVGIIITIFIAGYGLPL